MSILKKLSNELKKTEVNNKQQNDDLLKKIGELSRIKEHLKDCVYLQRILRELQQIEESMIKLDKQCKLMYAGNTKINFHYINDVGSSLLQKKNLLMKLLYGVD